MLAPCQPANNSSGRCTPKLSLPSLSSNHHLLHCLPPPSTRPGIKRLDLAPPGTDGSKAWAASGITAPDGEYLPLNAPVVTEGRPEEWLCRVEDAMFAATKRQLLRVLDESRGEGEGMRVHRGCGRQEDWWAPRGRPERRMVAGKAGAGMPCPQSSVHPPPPTPTPKHGAGAKKDRWVRSNPGQMVLTASQVLWTAECERALSEADGGARAALRLLRKRWLAYLTLLTGITRSQLSKVDRNKVGGVGLGVEALGGVRQFVRAQGG